MAYLIRAITRAKWEPKDDLNENEISADVFKDLKTRDSKLSLWICEQPNLMELKKIVLAIASGRDKLEKVDIVWIDKKILESEGITFEFEPGDTPVEDLKELHLNAIKLDIFRLEEIALKIADAVRQKNQFRRFSIKETAELIKNALNSQRLRSEDLKPGLKKDIEKRFLVQSRERQ